MNYEELFTSYGLDLDDYQNIHSAIANGKGAQVIQILQMNARQTSGDFHEAARKLDDFLS